MGTADPGSAWERGGPYVMRPDARCQRVRVSRCGRWVRQFGQYFLISMRSGSLRLFFRVM